MPWSLRPFAWTSRSPAWVGLGIAGAWFLFYLACTVLFGDELGRFARARWSSWPLEATWSLLIGMTPAVTAWSLRGSLRDVRDLAPALEATPEQIAVHQREVTSPPRAMLRVVGAGAVVVTTALMAPDTRYWVDDVVPPATDPAFVWLLGRNILNWWLIARALVVELSLARGFLSLGRHLGRVDLLERGPLAPFGRHGLRSVLLWMLLVALFAPIYILGGAERVLGVSLLGVLAGAGVAFLVPVWGAHQRLREAKAAELARVREQLRAQRSRLLGGEATSPQAGRLADLLTWEAWVAAAGEWPFGASTVVRLVLYVAIGLGSWVGAAAVERLLSRLLG